MLNRYPLWKYLVLIILLIFSIIYAIPNLYGEDPAIQITGKYSNIVNTQQMEEIHSLLKQKKINTKSLVLTKNHILIRFTNTDSQLSAHETISSSNIANNYTVALNLASCIPAWLAKLAARPMKMGLDLRGGIHFLIKIDMDNILDKLQEQRGEILKNELMEKEITYLSISKFKKTGNMIVFNQGKIDNNIINNIIKLHPELIIKSNNNILYLILNNNTLNKIKEKIIQQNVDVLRNRINKLGIRESLVQKQGNDFIAVELPGIQDTARAKEIIGTTATLEFHLVNNDISPFLIRNHNIPFNSEIKKTSDGNYLLLNKQVILTGDHITDATVSKDLYNQPQVNISLDSTGGKILQNFSKNNIGKLIATLFVEYLDSSKNDSNHEEILQKNETIINIARIQSILGRNFCITGIKNIYEARQLSLLLRAGTLSAPIKIVEERIIGPTMGKQNIIKGLKACCLGLIIPMIFMVIYYKTFGIIVSISLIINFIMIVSIMSLIPGATLTMPGIAGIVLTTAVAVDANVLINERIKEEFTIKKSIQQAIHWGYKGASSSIIDANITNLLTNVILYSVGNGCIKGFAITTIIGILTSVFTSIIGTRAIVNAIYGRKKISKISI
ncbi:protein translocase subunit SecD [Candidatus Ishikawella capsulata]|uniref:Protein translocase subunit SecD n=1 Tax=Candidatus Ishikawaella capsulata Mpkobe TaxID=476281 RepID=C5WCN9_9ENTR|nr:protein translocase subunit SecD [Candidatus Ishikawaella capsulata]BAH83095.1 protein export protein SecD [Candidatus Ishikawaella capsulata Mpkobe]